EDLSGDWDIQKVISVSYLDHDDVFQVRTQSGGGYGDPLDRDPSRVLEDVRSGVVSVEAGRSMYGVAIDAKKDAVSAGETERARHAIRERRRERSRPVGGAVAARAKRKPAAAGAIALNELLHVVREGGSAVVQCVCGQLLPDATANFKTGTLMDSVARAAKDLGMTVEQLLGQTTRFGHGTTVATNALLTHTGAVTGLITTRGHEDALFMGRIKQKIAGLDEDQIHDFLLHDKAIPGIVPRKLIRGINERVDHKGAVVVALSDDDVRRVTRGLVEVGCDAIGVSLLWSYMRPAHEQRVRELILAQHPNVAISISSEIAPVLGEYERT